MTSILREDQFFDNECDFAKVYTRETLKIMERILLKNRISYFIREEDTSIFAKLFASSANRYRCVIRINKRDIEDAMEAVRGVRGIDIVCREPVHDWCPKEKLRRLEAEKALAKEAEKSRAYGR